MDPSKVKKVVALQHNFCQNKPNLPKSNVAGQRLFLDFGWIHCYEITLLYLYSEVWRVTYQGFSV